MIRNSLPLAALLLLAACGGGSDTAVSANPPAPAPADTAAVTTAPTSTVVAPGVTTAPTPTPTPTVSTPTTPTAPGPVTTAPVTTAPVTTAPVAPPPPAPGIPGTIVLSALQSGIGNNPAETNPYGSGCRRVTSTAQDYFFLCGAMGSYQIRSGFPGASGLGAWGSVNIEPIVNGTSVIAVVANGLRLDGPALDLSKVDPAIDSVAATWSVDQSQVQLVVSSIAGQADTMRVCWNASLPPPPAVTGPPGFEPLVRKDPLKRLMCGVYARAQIGPDRGGYLVDDVGGAIAVYDGSW